MDKLLELEALKKENKQLEQDLYIALHKIDKAIEYTKHIDDWDIKDFRREELLEILGGTNE